MDSKVHTENVPDPTAVSRQHTRLDEVLNGGEEDAVEDGEEEDGVGEGQEEGEEEEGGEGDNEVEPEGEADQDNDDTGVADLDQGAGDDVGAAVDSTPKEKVATAPGTWNVALGLGSGDTDLEAEDEEDDAQGLDSNLRRTQQRGTGKHAALQCAGASCTNTSGAFTCYMNRVHCHSNPHVNHHLAHHSCTEQHNRFL